MSNGYQIGSDVEWVKHANDELKLEVKRTKSRLNRVRLVCILLMLLLAWAVYQYSKVAPIENLWDVKSLWSQGG